MFSILRTLSFSATLIVPLVLFGCPLEGGRDGPGGSGGSGGSDGTTVESLCDRLDECNQLAGLSALECIGLTNFCLDENFSTQSLKDDWATFVEGCLDFSTCGVFVDCALDVADATGCPPFTDGTGGSGGEGGTGGTPGTGGTTGEGGTVGTGGSGGEVVYEQDFESLILQGPDELANDGWVVGANVFAPDGTTFLYNYFPFPAPNGGPAFSAVALGEGGLDQGAQQLSVYNDYNNADHAVGNIIEAVVFQERTIVAGEVGTTISFTFDAKRGNINDPADANCAAPNVCDSTAEAFIHVLDSLGGTFFLVAFDGLDATNLPDTWDTFTISVPIDASLVGQLLQFGARSRATNYEPSGIFYDNILVAKSPTP